MGNNFWVNIIGQNKFFNITACKIRGELSGHVCGVRSLVYSKDNDILISAGFEFDAFAWDVSGRHQLFTMRGKNYLKLFLLLLCNHQKHYYFII